jgi:hypothetical protein
MFFDTTFYAQRSSQNEFPITWWFIETISHLGNFVIFPDFDGDLSFLEMSCILPYVLNWPIYLFLFEILSMSVEVDILHNTSMLQDLLQICKIY